MRRAPAVGRLVCRAWLHASFMLALALGAGLAQAHKGSDAYLDVQEISVTTVGVVESAAAPAGRSGGTLAERNFRFGLSVAIKDLDLLVPVDANSDGKVTWGEVKAATPLLLALVNEGVNLEPPSGQQTNAVACRLNWQSDGIERRSDGAYVRFAAQARCPATQALALRYTLLKDQDATHRLLVAGRIAGQDLLTTTSPLQAAALALGAAVATTPGTGATTAGAPAIAQPSGRWQALRDYFALGVHHLLEGYDHLAFLLALVLPLRLRLRTNARQSLRPEALGKMPGVVSTTTARHASENDSANGSAHGNANAKSNVWWALLRTITAFTIGHSITLMLATLGWTQASPVWVEPVIALSIAVTALLNLRPVPWVRVDVLALLFGMVHGFGFAGLLQEAAAPSGLLPWALAGFNLGVEAGQLIAVSAWVLLSQLFVAKVWYPSVVVRGGSVLLVGVATFWFWQRVS